MSRGQTIAFALVADDMLSIPRIIRAALIHPWVATYQVGFGPPLVRSSPKLTALAREARSALDKLDLYLEHCILDRAECQRLAELQRRLLVRRHGPVEAEDLDEAATSALDLSLRLHQPSTAPRNVRRSMQELGVDLEASIADCALDRLTGRFVLRLHDARNLRLLSIPSVRQAVGGHPDEAVVVELRTDVAARKLWVPFLEAHALVAPCTPVEIGAPASHARVIRDGERC